MSPRLGNEQDDALCINKVVLKWTSRQWRARKNVESELNLYGVRGQHPSNFFLEVHLKKTL